MPGSMNFLLNICGYVCVCTSCYTCSFKYREVRKQLVELVRQLCGSLRLNIGWLAGGKHLYPLRYVPSPSLLTFSIAAFSNCTVSLEGWPCACYKKQLCSAACASVAGIAVQVSGSTRLPLLRVCSAVCPSPLVPLIVSTSYHTQDHECNFPWSHTSQTDWPGAGYVAKDKDGCHFRPSASTSRIGITNMHH